MAYIFFDFDINILWAGFDNGSWLENGHGRHEMRDAKARVWGLNNKFKSCAAGWKWKFYILGQILSQNPVFKSQNIK